MATFSESVPFFLTEKIADGSCCVTSMAETLNAIQTVSIIYLISSGWLSGWGWCSGSCCSGRGRSCCSGNQGLVVEEIDWPVHRIHDHSNLLEKWSINQDQKQVLFKITLQIRTWTLWQESILSYEFDDYEPVWILSRTNFEKRNCYPKWKQRQLKRMYKLTSRRLRSIWRDLVASSSQTATSFPVYGTSVMV